MTEHRRRYADPELDSRYLRERVLIELREAINLAELIHHDDPDLFRLEMANMHIGIAKELIQSEIDELKENTKEVA